MTKNEFFKNIEEIIFDGIYLTDNLDELNKEIENNHWSIGIDSATSKKVTNEEFQYFFKKVVENRIAQLDKSKKNMDLIFYAWFDEQSGNLNLNFINSGHKKLPFGTKLEFVSSIDVIISDFLSSKYLEGIQLEELNDESNDADVNKKTISKLKVYKEQIMKSTKAQHGL